jgi:cytochrome P450
MIPAHVKPEQVFEFDIYADPRIGDDVQGTYADTLRNAPDVFWTPLNGGHWMIQRSEIVTDIVKDPAVFSAREMQIPRVPDPPYMIPLSVDPPQNVPYRNALMPHFSARKVAAMEPKMRAQANAIIDAVIEQGACDFIHDVAAVFPVSVFMELMGLPLDKLHEFREIADTYFKARTPEDFPPVMARIAGIFMELMAHCTAHPGDNLMTHLLAEQIDGRPITQDEILAMCLVLFLGGMDTVTNVTGFSFRYLASDPALQARLAADHNLIAKFATEGLRIFGVINTPRLVVQDCDRHGVSFRKGEMVLNILSQTGRDEHVHSDPDRFDIDRDSMIHLNFSTGPHLCLGHILARAELRIMAEEWIKRVPTFRAKPGMKHGFRIGTVIALESLPLEWGSISEGRA